MSQSKEILKYFNLYYSFGQLTKNAHTIYHNYEVLKNKNKIQQDIERFFKRKNEDKHIKIEHVEIVKENQEKYLKITPSTQLKKFAQSIATHKFYLNNNKFQKLKEEYKHKLDLEGLNEDNEILKYFLDEKIIQFNQQFILALNTLYLTIITKDEKIVTFIYPLEYIELDEYNSAILGNLELLKNEKIYLNFKDLTINRNEFIFNRFLSEFPKEKPNNEDENELPTLNYLINKEIEDITIDDLIDFLPNRSKLLKSYLIKDNIENFIENIDIPIIHLNNEEGLVVFEYTQDSLINFDLIIDDTYPISEPLNTYLQTIFDKKVHYYENFKTNEFIPYYGTNTKEYPLAKGQAEVLENYIKKQSLIPVIGAPGTGKTTLFKSIIANNITTRALNVIYKNKDYNNMMLMTSTARKAVDNVIKDIEEDNPFMGALVLLSKEDTQKNNRRAKVLSKILTPLSQIIEEKLFDSKKFNKFIKEFYENKEINNDTFLDAYENYQKYKIKKLYDEFKEIIPVLKSIEYDDVTTEFLKKEIINVKEYIDKILTLFTYKETMKLNISEIRKESDELLNELNNFTVELFNLLNKFESDNFVETKPDIDLIEKYKEYFLSEYLESLLDNFYDEYNSIIDANFIKKIIYKITNKEKKLFKKYKSKFDIKYKSNKEFLDFLKEIQKIRKKYNIFLNKLNKLTENYSILYNYDKLKTIQEKLKITDDEIYKHDSIEEFFRLTPTIYKTNYVLYQLSEAFLILDAYEKFTKENLASILIELKNTLELKNLKNSEKQDIENNLIIASRFFPVIGATNKKINILYSSKYKIDQNEKEKTYEHAKFYHTILIDEAGMIPSADAIHSINIGKQALVVGDPKQLEPIPEIPDILLNEFENYVKKKNPVYEHFDKIFSSSKFSAYDVASGVSIKKAENEKSEDFIGKAYLLDEHRRCQKDIAELFIKVANYPKSLKIKTIPIVPEYLLKDKNNIPKYLEFYDCKLSSKPNLKNTNPLEIEVISYLLKDLKKRGVNLEKDVGIITPFLNQSLELINRFGNLLNHSNQKQKIGTVHKFQGAEFDVIIFSSVVNQFNGAIDFVANNINLLNVSISRAKKLYIHVGDRDILQNSGKRPMIKYMTHFNEKGLFRDYTEIRNKLNEDIIDKDTILEKFRKLKIVKFKYKW